MGSRHEREGGKEGERLGRVGSRREREGGKEGERLGRVGSRREREGGKEGERLGRVGSRREREGVMAFNTHLVLQEVFTDSKAYPHPLFTAGAFRWRTACQHIFNGPC